MGFSPLWRAQPLLRRTACWLLAIGFTASAAADPAVLQPKAGLRKPLVAQQVHPVAPQMIERLIVTPHPTRGGRLNWQLDRHNTSRLSSMLDRTLSVERKLADGTHLLKLGQPVTLDQARAISARLQQSGEVLAAEPDLLMQAYAIAPNDPGYATWPGQWHYLVPGGSNLGGVDLPAAWDLTLGGGHVSVAVIDSGYRPHVDLQAMLPGYDFITSASVANDGNSRDADASDPGDHAPAGACGRGAAASNSSWHGTHVMGTVAALMNNGLYGTGVAPNVRILPVRVLGRCGGYTSDIVDGMRWAAGISVAGAPGNPNPARILNLSLGSAGTCSAAFQSAVNDVNARGAVVVVATGNGGVNTLNQPANCTGVVAVTAHAIDGDSGDYANIGTQTTLSAPGGGCGTLSPACAPGYTADGVPVYSLGNTGSTAPQADSGALKYGTSMAAPHVAGTIALMLSLDPQMTRDQVVTVLRSSARPFPAGTACLLPENRGLCGAGLLDAHAALTAIAAVVRMADANQIVPPLSTVTLSASLQLPDGRTASSIRWTPVPANPQVLTLMNADTLHASFIAPATGTYGFTLTITDNRGASTTASATVRVNSVPMLAPVAGQQIPFGGNLAVQLHATDADRDVMVFHAGVSPPGVSLSASGLLSWTHASPVGRHRITWYASDGLGSSLPGEVIIDVVDDGVTSLAAGSGGGGSMEGDLLLLAAAGLAVARRFHRR